MLDFQNEVVWFLKWHFWFPKFVAFDLSNGTLDFRNLSRLISQMTLLISKTCLVWFLKWHFWFPKFVSFDFSNDTFDFQNLSRLISQMAFLISKMRLIWILSTWQFLWVVRPTQGRGDTQSVVTTRPNEAHPHFSPKPSLPPDRVWVSQGGFRPLCPKQGYIFVKTRV